MDGGQLANQRGNEMPLGIQRKSKIRRRVGHPLLFTCEEMKDLFETMPTEPVAAIDHFINKVKNRSLVSEQSNPKGSKRRKK